MVVPNQLHQLRKYFPGRFCRSNQVALSLSHLQLHLQQSTVLSVQFKTSSLHARIELPNAPMGSHLPYILLNAFSPVLYVLLQTFPVL